MLWTAKDSRIVRANQRMADLLGYSVEELQQMRYEDLLVPGGPPEYRRIRDQEAATRLPAKDLERRYLRKDGGIFWGLRADHPGAVGARRAGPEVRDDPGRHRAKQAEDKIRFQAELLASVEQAVIATDMTGSVIFWNRFAETMSGWPAADVLGRQIVLCFRQSRHNTIPARSRANCDRGTSWSGEFSVERRDGVDDPRAGHNSPVKDGRRET